MRISIGPCLPSGRGEHRRPLSGTAVKADVAVRTRLMAIYRALFKAYGPQRWWPADTQFEVMVGAVLTQNTAWGNVEKAIKNLKQVGPLTPARLYGLHPRRLASLIRPSGYFNVKAKRLRNLLHAVVKSCRGDIGSMLAEEPGSLRRRLLGINGIGPETADSILLYAAGVPVFVVDAYTRRVFSRLGFVPLDADYYEVQRLFMDHLPPDAALYNEYHALIVRHGKERCRGHQPLCADCPVQSGGPSGKEVTKYKKRSRVPYHI